MKKIGLFMLLLTLGVAKAQTNYNVQITERVEKYELLNKLTDYAYINISATNKIYDETSVSKVKLKFDDTEYNIDLTHNSRMKWIIVKTGRYDLSVEKNGIFHAVEEKDIVINSGTEYSIRLFIDSDKDGKVEKPELPEQPEIDPLLSFQEEGPKLTRSVSMLGGNGMYKTIPALWTDKVDLDSTLTKITLGSDTTGSKTYMVNLSIIPWPDMDADPTKTMSFTMKEGEFFDVISEDAMLDFYFTQISSSDNFTDDKTEFRFKCLALDQGKIKEFIIDAQREPVPLKPEDIKTTTIEVKNDVVRKPVIYLYTDTELDLTLNLKTEAELLFTYPEYKNEWKGTVKTNGDFESNGKSYPYIFWDGKMDVVSKLDNLEEGFVVEKEHNVAFFEEKLAHMGLNDKEIADFITFWAPLMMDADKHYVKFLTGEEYDNKIGSLNYSVQPDSEVRIFMVFSKLEGDIQVKPQLLPTFKREGFTVVEWGGSEVDLKMNQFDN